MNTTLKDLNTAIKENRLKNLAVDMVKYQNFKTSAIIKKIDNAGYSNSSLVTMIFYAIRYIKTGEVNARAKTIYPYIDEALKNHVQPLTPSKQDQRSARSRQKATPIQNVLKKINEQAISKENNRFLGIKIGDKIIIKESLDEIKAFQEGLIFMGNNDSKIVKVKIEEVNE